MCGTTFTEFHLDHTFEIENIQLGHCMLLNERCVADVADEGDAEPKEVLYDVRLNFTLGCTLPNEKSLPYVWYAHDSSS